MKFTDLQDGSEQKFLLVFVSGDEVASTLLQFAAEHKITAAHFTAIGAFSGAVLGFYDLGKKEYLRNEVQEQVEVVSLTGDIALDKGKPKVHAHVVVAKRDGMALGGHLLEAHVRPTLELILERSPVHLQRRMDPASGLALIQV